MKRNSLNKNWHQGSAAHDNREADNDGIGLRFHIYTGNSSPGMICNEELNSFNNKWQNGSETVHKQRSIELLWDLMWAGNSYPGTTYDYNN